MTWRTDTSPQNETQSETTIGTTLRSLNSYLRMELPSSIQGRPWNASEGVDAFFGYAVVREMHARRPDSHSICEGVDFVANLGWLLHACAACNEDGLL
jgi:hypothetical protein